jgi:hypothetical protein
MRVLSYGEAIKSIMTSSAVHDKKYVWYNRASTQDALHPDGSGALESNRQKFPLWGVCTSGS